MKTLAAHILIVSLTLIVSCTHENGGTISGVIKEPYLSRSIRGVVVSIPDIKQSTLSDSNGFFTFRNLPVGNYKLQVEDTLRKGEYQFPSGQTVEVRKHSTIRITIVAKALTDEIRGEDRFTLSFANKSTNLFLGQHFWEYAGPNPHFRIFIKDSTKRFISSLNQFQGLVTIATSKQALDFVRLLTTRWLVFEFNELGDSYMEPTIYNERIGFGIPAAEFTRLNLHDPIVSSSSDSSYTVDRFIFAHNRNVYHVVEGVTRSGSYKIASRDSIGVLSSFSELKYL